jgi:hypothetical protein
MTCEVLKMSGEFSVFLSVICLKSSASAIDAHSTIKIASVVSVLHAEHKGEPKEP